MVCIVSYHLFNSKIGNVEDEQVPPTLDSLIFVVTSAVQQNLLNNKSLLEELGKQISDGLKAPAEELQTKLDSKIEENSILKNHVEELQKRIGILVEEKDSLEKEHQKQILFYQGRIVELENANKQLLQMNRTLEEQKNLLEGHLKAMQTTNSQLEQRINNLEQERDEMNKQALIRQFVINVEFEFKLKFINKLPEDQKQKYTRPDWESVVLKEPLWDISKTVDIHCRSEILKSWFGESKDNEEKFIKFLNSMQQLKSMFNIDAHPTQYKGKPVTKGDIEQWIKILVPVHVRPSRIPLTVSEIQNNAIDALNTLEVIRTSNQDPQFLY